MTAPLRHLAISPDGNRRWALARGLAPEAGYSGATRRLTELIDETARQRIPYLSVHVLNRRNLERPAAEINVVMDAIAELAIRLEQSVSSGQLAVHWAGHRGRVPNYAANSLGQLEAASSKGAPLHLALLIDYDAMHALRQAGGDLNHLAPAGFPPVDLYIRTSGDLRTSGFDPLRLAHAELVFAPGGFPAFDAVRLRAAIAEYERRDRRLGR